MKSFQKKSASISTAIVTAFAPVLPAMAIVSSSIFILTSNFDFFQVDERLNGDGAGLPLGINDGAIGIVLGTVPLAVFSFYFIAGKQDGQIIAGGKDDDSGLSL